MAFSEYGQEYAHKTASSTVLPESAPVMERLDFLAREHE